MRKKLALFVVIFLLCVSLGGNAYFGSEERQTQKGKETHSEDDKAMTASTEPETGAPVPGALSQDSILTAAEAAEETERSNEAEEPLEPTAAANGETEPPGQESWMQIPGETKPGLIKPVDADGENEWFKTVKITISAAGDCTLGGDLRQGPNGFMREFSRQDSDYSYFLRNVRRVFRKDDLTIANMEGTFASAGPHKGNEFIISGPPELVAVFPAGCVDVVTVANNHMMDYLQKGYEETIAVLDDAGLAYFGNEYTALIDVKGIMIGLFGYSMPQAGNDKEKISKNISLLREEGADIVIAYYHWGIERDYYPNANQKAIAHHTIDSGADLVLGSHPHVLQGIEEYKGKNIVYSLGNFCFGANNNPFDKDTMIYQHTFVFSEGELIESSHKIIPCSISSVKDRNNYQPTLLEGAEAERVLAKVEQLSSVFK